MLSTLVRGLGDLSMSDARVPEFSIDDVAALQRQLDACRAELAALRQEQATFAHGISHDLRAPLRAIESFAALAAADAGLAAGTRGHIERVRAAATRMSGLIEALLEYSRAGRAALDPDWVDLGLLVEWAGAELREADPYRESTIDVDPGLSVRGYAHLLKVLVQQLLDNAWKFSRTRDCVWIRVSGARAGARMHVAVRDAGCGFDMRYAEKMLQPFQRLHGPEQGGGHGLGLAIAQRIVARHGGQLRAHALAEGGSEFRFDLEAAPGG